jgi:hypothetical protein
MEGIMDHGRQSVDFIIREKQLATFQLYHNDCIGETDCINIKESLVCGCIPIISNFGVYRERDGFHIDLEPREEYAPAIANKIINLMRDFEQVTTLRNKLYKSPTILSWKDIANRWVNNF